MFPMSSEDKLDLILSFCVFQHEILQDFAGKDTVQEINLGCMVVRYVCDMIVSLLNLYHH